MKKILISICISNILLFAGCISQQSASDKAKYKPGFKFQAGINKGGIVENTDMDAYSGATHTVSGTVDAYSGATKTGFNTGAKVLLPVRRNAIETGIDYMYNNQTFTYQDNVNGYNGKRKLGTSQFMVPLTYNIGLFRKKYEEGLITFKFGYLIQFNSVNIKDETVNLPEYKILKFSNGFTAGLATSPFHFKNGSKLGLYIDMYRGTRIYEDFYNQKEFEMPASSFIKYGISYQF
jgi:hypothetical protein